MLQPQPRVHQPIFHSQNAPNLKGAFIEWALSFAIVCANRFALPGVALNPPVPHPQLKYNPSTSHLLTYWTSVWTNINDTTPLT